MGNKSLKPNTKLLFKSNENLYYTTDILNPNFTKKPKSPIVSDSNQNLRIKPIKSPPYSKNNEILKEIHKTNSFINKFLDFSVCEKFNCSFAETTLLTCNYRLIKEYEQDKISKIVHFSDENKANIDVLKKIQRISMKIKEKNPKTKGNPLIIQEISVIGDLTLQKMSFKPELIHVKNEKIQNILSNNFNNKKKTKENSNIPSKKTSHQRTNSKKKVEIDKLNTSKKDGKLSKSPKPLKISKNNDQKPTKNLKLDIPSNFSKGKEPYLGPIRSSKSYHEAPVKQNRPSTSRNSSVRSKENQPPMKSILKKKPKFLKRESDESSEENACKTNRESFQTVCLADLNESIGSKSQKTQRFSSSEEENYSVKPVKLNNPVKIHLKLDDLLNFESVYNNNQIITNKNMKNNKEIAFFKKNENLTTSDTSKEDLTKIKMFKQGINVKNESISSSSISDYHKISDIVHCNVDLQKIHKEKRKKKGNEGSSSQFNHISEEASEMNN